MSKQKYIAVLTEGALEPEIIKALNDCGYILKRESDYQGRVTHHYEYAGVAEEEPMPFIKIDFTELKHQ